ncbi:hypothetical protein [Mycobacterium sp. AT1]|uniref:hypothetical protein n=1 Tax=Mycobacterium sp. AT1 TaxID=1961706 RepID=UPI0009AE179F|nr:hypothetical protein [Mycobacterium sp. AT1]OPX06744.1 hypothetical protein B1790_26215 [Mycobacterium sp. AT1]
MAKSTMRLAAGVALALAITVAGGPGAVLAAADPGSSGSSHGHSRDGGHSRSDSRADSRGSHGFGGSRHDSGPRHDRGPRGGDYRDRDERGNSRGERARDNPGVVETAAPTASRGVVSAPALAPDVPASAPQKPVRTGRAGFRPVVPAAAVDAPRVVVGNGRTSEARVETSFVPTQPLPVAVAPRLLTRVAPPVAPPQPVTEQAVSVPEPRSEPPAAALWAKVKPAWPTGAIFGMAGLLLAPIAGMWLGHRQARAAKSASQLVSR